MGSPIQEGEGRAAVPNHRTQKVTALTLPPPPRASAYDNRSSSWPPTQPRASTAGTRYSCRSIHEALPEPLAGTATADALQAIVELDLEALADIAPPRGYGRD